MPTVIERPCPLGEYWAAGVEVILLGGGNADKDVSTVTCDAMDPGLGGLGGGPFLEDS